MTILVAIVSAAAGFALACLFTAQGVRIAHEEATRHACKMIEVHWFDGQDVIKRAIRDYAQLHK